MTISVRYAEEGDGAVCAALDGHLEVVGMNRKIAAGEVVVALNEGEVVGHLRLGYLWSSRPHIEQIRVNEASRRTGVGKALLAFIEDAERRQGVRWLFSSCSSNEKQPQNWHVARGFEPVGEVDLGDERETFLRKEL